MIESKIRLVRGKGLQFEITNCDLKFGEEMKALIPVEVIEKKILLIRDEKVMLDADLAEIYGVTTKRLNEQVKRNADRFPADFAFQLSSEEWEGLKALNDESNRSQFATGSQKLESLSR